MQKVRRHGSKRSAPTACKRMVSGTISLPLRGTFHLSLTVLVHYRSPLVFILAGWSPLVQSGFPVPGFTQGIRPKEPHEFRLRGYNPLRPGFPAWFDYPRGLSLLRSRCGMTTTGPTTPYTQRPQAFTYMVWAVPLSLATTKGIETFFLFLRVLRCIISPGSLLLSYVFRQG